mgnify:CR=1 FL=1
MLVKILDKLEGFAFVLIIVLIANKNLTLALILLAIGGVAMLLETWKIEKMKSPQTNQNNELRRNV